MNIFGVLGAARHEDPHDRMLAWLLDPAGDHGLTNFAQTFVKALFGIETTERVRRVSRPFELSPDSWPDVVVEFDRSLLVIENKVNAKALREGQLSRQHELAKVRQGDAPLFHALILPDRLSCGAWTLPNPDFRVVRYGELGRLIAKLCPRCEASVSSILCQYSDFILGSLGKPLGTIRCANHSTIAARTSDLRVWDEQAFLAKADSFGIGDAQRELIDLLTVADGLEPRFASGGEGGMFRVFLPGTTSDVLWIGADGVTYLRWGTLQAGQRESVKRVMGDLVKSGDNTDGSHLLERIGSFDVSTFLARLQAALSNKYVAPLTASLTST